MKRFPVAFVVASILFFLSASLSISVASEEATVYIAYLECPEGVKPEAFSIRTLAVVLGRSLFPLLLFPSLHDTFFSV